MPVGAFGGKADIMNHIAPLGPVYQAGTLSGNPVAMAAGLAALNAISDESQYQQLEEKVTKLMDGFRSLAAKHGIPLTTNQAGGMFGFFFTKEEQVTSFEQATQCNMEQFRAFYHAMLEQGIYLAPSAYETGFMSFAHTNDDIEETLRCADVAFARLAK